MIYGDPYQFAVIAQRIEQWSNQNFSNGVFHFYIDGMLFPEHLNNAVIDIAIDEMKYGALYNPVVDIKLFALSKEKAFQQMMELTYNDDNAKNSNNFNASVTTLIDAGCFIFSCSDGIKIRIIGARLSELYRDVNNDYVWRDIDSPHIYEVILSNHDILDIKNKLDCARLY